MTKYLVLYRSTTPAGDMMASLTPEQSKAGMELWTAWADKAGSAIVDLGSPVASVGAVGATSTDSHSIAGWSVLEAPSKDDVVALLDGHPHFQTPGENSIEILEFLAIPGM